MTDALYDHQIQSVIIEEATNITNFIDANLWDEARVLEELYTQEGTAAPY
jgi:hypothetical protein